MSGASAKTDPELRMHKEWLALLQPVGLVVSPLALVRKQAVIDRDGAVRLQALLRPLVDAGDPQRPALLRDLPALFEQVLGWRSDEYLGGPSRSGARPLPDALEVRLPELDDLLRPTYAVPDISKGNTWMLLIEELPARTPLDEAPKQPGRGWHTSPQAKFERMLRELDVPIGLLCNGELLRLVYAPRGETSGHLSFPIAAMTEVANRPMLGALHLLLSADRLLGESDDRRLPALLHESRKCQHEVSTELAEQVLGALIELLRGFQAADETANRELLGACTSHDPKHVYGGLLTVLLRLVFLLYAEDRGLLPNYPTWSGNYAVVGLFERLREDHGRNPDTMDQRFGAWAWLLTLFRLVFLGGGHGPAIHLPARKGQLFDPGAYPFLEGRPRDSAFEPGERRDPPRVSDGTIYRVLQGLLVLGGERLSYRSLDVEQIGSVYESMMGYEVERAKGPSIGIGKQHVIVDLSELLAQKPENRVRWLEEQTGVKLGGGAQKRLESATTPDDAVAALQRRISKRTPTILGKGALYLQPGEERRRTGSHYTPRSLTEPIVRTTLRPLLEDLGPTPTEAQVLALKVCDPAMGSGAFLVETCRQLAEVLVRAWTVHGTNRRIPADEEPLLHARRLVAEHCLYGVDKNPFAVNLAKLSLWLATLAKEHPFTFLDHALKCGDSLVGLTRRQIAEFRWDHEGADDRPLSAGVREQVVAAGAARLKIHEEGEDADAAKRMWNEEAERALEDARLRGDAVIAAFFAEDKPKAREQRRAQLCDLVQRWHGGDLRARRELVEVVGELRGAGVVPFHWEIEFPEVFGEGFSAYCGNPPFLGGKRISSTFGTGFRDWLTSVHSGSSSNADLSAHFFRRAFAHLGRGGTLGFIATNTIAQGDTRSTGLEWITENAGQIYAANRRLRWPGAASVVVSTAHIRKHREARLVVLDGRRVPKITAFLFHAGGNRPPTQLAGNASQAFVGSYILGMGFMFDDDSPTSSPLARMHEIVQQQPAAKKRIRPYLGGAEINSSPLQTPTRYVIDFGTMQEAECRRRWPALMKIVEEKVRPEREGKPGSYSSEWWLFARRNMEGRKLATQMDRMLVNSLVSSKFAFAFVPTSILVGHTANMFAFDQDGAFCILQCRAHEVWAHFLGSSMKDDRRYIASDCFATFPFPKDWQSNESLESAGQTYYEYRAQLMIRNDEGLTKTYNRFHDPDEDSPDIAELRELHAAMDRAVLEAYGWHDLAERATCELQLEYEEPEEEDDDESRARKKKKPWRYKWPQDVHDEVLARLLELNQQYAEEERRLGEAAAANEQRPRPAAKQTPELAKRKAEPEQVPLLRDDDTRKACPAARAKRR